MLRALLNSLYNFMRFLFLDELHAWLYKRQKKKKMAKYTRPPSSGGGSSSSGARKPPASSGGGGGGSTSTAGGEKRQFADSFQKRQSTQPRAPAAAAQSPTEKEKKSTIDNIKNKKSQAKDDSFLEQARKKKGNLVYLVRGKDRGKPAWHYVLVKQEMLSVFLRKTQGGSIDVAQYGSVLKSGWGVDPPQEVVDEIKRDFGG